MLQFECPSCKTKLQAAEQHAGKSIQCPKCQAMAKVPSPDDAGITAEPSAAPPLTAVTDEPSGKASRKGRDEDDDRDDDRPRRRRDRSSSGGDAAKAAGMSMVVILLLVGGGFFGCCLIGSILVALLVPAVQKVREAAARTQSTNNLKNIGLAALNFNDMNKRLPFNGTKKAVGGDNTSGSWAFQILPMIDAIDIFQRADRARSIPTYMCPGRGRPAVETTNGGGAWSDYFYNNFLNDPMQASNPSAPDMKQTQQGIQDGSSNTILAGHGLILRDQYPLSGNVTLCSNIFNGGTLGTMRSGNNGKTNPGGVTLRRDDAVAPTVGSWGGPFPQGGLFVFCDGSVRMIPYSTPNLGAFLTPNGGEVAIVPD